MKMEFIFSRTDKRPMYQQIMEQVRQQVAANAWPPKTPLPSVQKLASEIKVSALTVRRAYQELEREGVIVTRQNTGSWVNEAVDLNRLRREELRPHAFGHSPPCESCILVPEECAGECAGAYPPACLLLGVDKKVLLGNGLDCIYCVYED